MLLLQVGDMGVYGSMCGDWSSVADVVGSAWPVTITSRKSLNRSDDGTARHQFEIALEDRPVQRGRNATQAR